MSTSLVFVYGTLKGDDPKMPVANRRRYLGEIDGFRMLGHSGFPGIIRGDICETISGEIIEYDDEEIQSRLDRIEGYNPNFPEQSFYRREKVEARCGKETMLAYVYIYQGSGMLQPEECPNIEIDSYGERRYYTWIGNAVRWS